MCPQGSMQLLLEESNEMRPLVRNDGLWYPMQTQDVRNVQLNILLNPVEGMYQNEMSRLGKLVNDYPNGVKLAAGER
jgi:hypothetical protein